MPVGFASRIRRQVHLPGRPGSCLPGLPQIRTCPIQASGSSRHGFTSRFAMRGRYVNPQPGYKAPDGCPTHDSMASIPLPSSGFPRYRFPFVNGTMGMCDFLRPFRRASFSFVWQYHAWRLSVRSCRPKHQTAGQGCVIRSPQPDMNAWRRSGPPKFLENPHVSTPCSQTPAETVASSHNNAPTRPPLFKRRRLPATISISGLNSTASTRAVYASPAASLQRTQDSLPAVGQTLPDGIGYPQGSYERFP